DAQVAAIAVAVAGSNSVEQPRNRFAGLQVRESLTPRVQVALLSQGDQLLHVRTRGLGLGDGGMHAVFKKNGRDQVAQQRAAVAGVASEFVSCIAMAHGESLFY